MIIIEK